MTSQEFKNCPPGDTKMTTKKMNEEKPLSSCPDTRAKLFSKDITQYPLRILSKEEQKEVVKEHKEHMNNLTAEDIWKLKH
jgi:hypothetical protein